MSARSRKIRTALLLTLAGGLLGSCDRAASASGEKVAAQATSRNVAECGPPPAGVEGPVRFARDVQPIFDDNCVACHQSGSAMMELVLEQGQSHGQIVGRQSKQAKLALVEPGAPSRSYLLAKARGTQAAVGSGERMPLGGQLDASAITILCDWIAGGAKQD